MSIFVRRRPLSATYELTGRRLARNIGLGYGEKPVKVGILPKLAFGEEHPLPKLTKNPLTGWHQDARRVGAVVKKIGMTCDWDDAGIRIPLTMLHVPQCQVVQQKTLDKEGYYALQVGSGDKKLKHTTKPLMGHFAKADVAPKSKLWEFPVTKDCMLPVGTTIHAPHFIPGQLVNVQGFSKGKGFQGGMKRWGFKGQPATHGVSVVHRSIGSTGCRQTPGRVFKGKKMPGNMGNAKRTIKNLMVFKVDPHNELVYVKGAVPGAAKTWLRMYDSESSEFFFQTPPYPVYKPNPEEIQPTEIRHHYDWLPPHFWARNDTTDPERLEILRAERLGQIFSEVNQPQTMSEIIQGIADRKEAEAAKKKAEEEAAAKQKLLQKKSTGKKKEAGEDSPKRK